MPTHSSTPQPGPQVVGRLGEKAAAPGQAVRGVLVKRGVLHTLMHAEDLPRFTKLHTGRVTQRQAIALHRPFSEVHRLCWGGAAGGWRQEPIPACACCHHCGCMAAKQGMCTEGFMHNPVCWTDSQSSGPTIHRSLTRLLIPPHPRPGGFLPGRCGWRWR